MGETLRVWIELLLYIVLTLKRTERVKEMWLHLMANRL